MDDIKAWMSNAKYTSVVRRKLQDGSFWKDKALVDELFDESKIEQSMCPPRAVRVGKEYQADIA